MASPARRGWSAPVASTSSTSGLTSRAATAAARTGPSRLASNPGAYAPCVRPATTDWAMTSSARRGSPWERDPSRCRSARRPAAAVDVPRCHATAAAHARSPGFPGPASPPANATTHPPISRGDSSDHGSATTAASASRASQCWRSTSACSLVGHHRALGSSCTPTGAGREALPRRGRGRAPSVPARARS